MRRAPQDGYDFGNKRQYRRNIWRTFADELKRRNLSVADSDVLLMPTSEGDEIEVARNAGFREEKMHVVDENPAIVATLRRRYPLIHTYGVTAGRAVERIARERRILLRCANLDFCGCISNSYVDELQQIAAYGSVGQAFDAMALIAVTTQRGRERTSIFSSLQTLGKKLPVLADLTDVIADSDKRDPWAEAAGATLLQLSHLDEVDRARVCTIGLILSLAHSWVGYQEHLRMPPPLAKLIRVGKYQSTSPMMWSIWEVQSPTVAPIGDGKYARATNYLCEFLQAHPKYRLSCTRPTHVLQWSRPYYARDLELVIRLKESAGGRPLTG
ncbi:MAG TPA: hypothetical protein DCP69_05800 [Candidatus Omnitrophica bacterium]|nr:hypothetical protein [Candidatus Omnitrophota bacterium]